MIKYIVAILFSFLLSYSSIYGFGEYVDDDSFFITDYSSNYFEFKLNDLSNRGTESVFNIYYNVKSSSSSVGDIENSYLSGFSFLFPVSDKHFLKFGVSPYTNSNISFFDNDYTYVPADLESGLEEAFAYSSDYQNLGGISKVYIDYSTQLSESFFLGLEYSHSFGNLEQNKKIKLYSLYDLQNVNFIEDYELIDSMIIKKIHTFKGSSVKVESKFRFNSSELILSGLYDFPLDINTRLFYNPFINPSNESLGIYEDLEQLESVLDANQAVQSRYDEKFKKITLQYKTEYRDSDYLILRLSSLGQFEYNSNLMYLPDSNIKSIYIGHESYNPNYRLSSFDYINYKMGVFYKILDNNDYDYGMELNCGINYAENSNIFISLKYGYRTHKFLNFNSENYYLINFNLENIENWFLKGDY